MSVPVESPRLIVLSGPSGAGKTSVATCVLRDPRFERALTATTRCPRGAERDGVDYEFHDRAAFLAAREAGAFLETAEVYGDLYGTPRKNVQAILDSGRHCLLVVDVQGVESLKALGVEALYVFVVAPSREELEARLRGRGQDAPASIRERIAAAEREMQKQDEFDVVLVNDDVENAARALARRVGVSLVG